MPLVVPWSVTIDGVPATERFNPYVMELEVEDKAGEGSDTARIKLDDTDGQIIMPRKGASIAITVLSELVFRGTTETPKFTYAKGQGRILTLGGKSFDAEKGAKEGKHFHKDDVTLEEYLKEFAQQAGLSIKVDRELGRIKRPYWNPLGRSFLHEGQRLAEELGGTFKIQGSTAVLAKRGQGATPAGGTMPTVFARVGVNVISIDIEPYEPRQAFKDVRVSWFDRKQAKFVEEKVDVELKGLGSGAPASARIPGVRADKDDSEARGKGRKAEVERETGSGSVEIEIDPTAKAEGTCIVEGSRDGVDGAYRIESAGLKVGKDAASTKLSLKQPDDKAGQDGRKAGQTG